MAKITAVKIRSMKFYDRQKELNELDRIRNVAFSVNSQMTVVTGRRTLASGFWQHIEKLESFILSLRCQ